MSELDRYAEEFKAEWRDAFRIQTERRHIKGALRVWLWRELRRIALEEQRPIMDVPLWMSCHISELMVTLTKANYKAAARAIRRLGLAT